MKKTVSLIVVLCSVVVFMTSCSKTEAKITLEPSEYVDTVTTDNYIIDLFKDYAQIVEYTGNDEELVVIDQYESVPVKLIGEFSFKDVTTLKKVTIPSSVVRIGEYAFSSCVNLEEIVLSDGISEICCNAFENNTSLKSVVIPDSLSYLGPMSFFGCNKLESVTIPDKLDNIGAGAFSYTKWLDNQDGDFVFAGDNVLIAYLGENSEVTLPENTKHVAAFFENYSLKKVICNNGLQSIDEMCFSDCSLFEEIEMSSTVKTIGKKAFIWCQSLKKIVLSKSLTTISDEAFSDCVSLKEFTFPSSVKTIGLNVFQRCDALKDITFSDSSIKPEYKLFSNKNTEVTIHASAGSSVEEYCKKNDYKFKAIE